MLAPRIGAHELPSSYSGGASSAVCWTIPTLPPARMDASHHPFHELFEQLGLPSSEADIRAFILRHRPLAADVSITEAAFWTPAQAGLLQQLLIQDADWAEVVDQLNAALH